MDFTWVNMVTQAQYESVMTNISGTLMQRLVISRLSESTREMVSYNDIEIFLSRLDHLSEMRKVTSWLVYHLPSVPEWEYVYRRSETLYHWEMMLTLLNLEMRIVINS